MVKIAKGVQMDLTKAKKGRKQNGDIWMLCNVYSDKEGSEDKVGVFIANSSEAQYWNVGVIEEIVEIRKSARKNGNGEWEPNYGITVRLSGSDTFAGAKSVGAAKFDEFMNLDGVEGEELPFE